MSASLSPTKFALKHLKKYRIKLALAIIWSILFLIIPMQIPVITGALIDGLNIFSNGIDHDNKRVWFYGVIELGQSREQVLNFAIITLTIVAIGYGISAYQRYYSRAIISRNFVFHLQRALLQKMEFLSLDVHAKYGSGDLLNRAIVDTNSVRPFIEGAIIRAAANIVRISYPLLLLLIIDPFLALISFSILPVQLMLMRVLQSRVRTASRKVRNNRAKLTMLVKENLDGLETIQTSNAETLSVQKLTNQGEKVEQAQVRSQRYYGMMMGFAWGLTSLGVGVTWWLGGMKVLDGSMTVGNLVIFSSFVLFVYAPIRRFTQVMNDHYRSIVAVKHIQEVLDTPSSVLERDNPSQLNVVHGRIDFRNVSLFYKEDHCPIFFAINLEIQPRKITAIVGRSGSGKSSFLKLIARLYDPSEGNILIDGQDIKKVSLLSLRSPIGVVTQTPIIFSGTIMENIRLSKPGATEDEVKEACLYADALQFIKNFDNGLDTTIGPGGIHLSGGHIQRIALARALLKKPKILLLDEPTSALDSESAKSIMTTLHRLKKVMTILIVTHSPEIFTKADDLIVIENKKVMKPQNHLKLHDESSQDDVCKIAYHHDILNHNISANGDKNADLDSKYCTDLQDQRSHLKYQAIGSSTNGRPVTIAYVGKNVDPQLKIFILAGQHGDEKYARMATEKLANYLAEAIDKSFPQVHVAVLSDANPDASLRNTRRGPAGIDINRDHALLRAKENRLIHSFVRSWRPHLIIDVHNYPSKRKYLRERNYTFCEDILVDIPTNLAVRKTLDENELKNLVKHVQSDLEPFNYSCGRYVIINSTGKARHSTHDIIDARNFLSLRYDTLTLLLEGREPLQKKEKNEKESTVSAQYQALLSILRWAVIHTAYLQDKPKPRTPTRGNKIVIRCKYRIADHPFRIKLRNMLTRQTEEAIMPVYNPLMEAIKYIELPYAYAIPSYKSQIIEILQSHGFASKRTSGFKLESIEQYLVRSVVRSDAEDKFPKVSVLVKKGEKSLHNYLLFPVNQEGGHSLALLLEPQSKYGLHRYSDLGLHLVSGLEYEILRVR
jgi:ABC-type multidrug transport system fused ATPase/permease subunit